MITAGTLIPIISILSFWGFLTLIVILKFILKMRDRQSRTLSGDEEKMLQDIWRSIQKMDTRISNLETILIQKERS